MTYMAIPPTRTPVMGVMKFTLLGNHNYTLSLYGLCSTVEKKIFKEKHQFDTFYLPLELGAMKFTISYLLTYRCYIPNLVKIGQVVFEKKLMDDA